MKALALALLLASPAPARASDTVAPLTAAEQSAVAVASARGAMLYAYDQAAWHGTDDMIARLPDYANRLAHYIVDGPATAPRLIFYDRQATPQALYVAQFRDGRLVEGKVLGPGDDRTLTPEDLRLIGALAAAKAALTDDGHAFLCANRPFNTVVLPPETPGGPIAVYFLSPQTSNDTLPFGGHYRIEVDAAGHAGPVHAFTRSCLPIPTHPPARDDAQPVGIVVSNLLDPTPTEIHVFSSLSIRRPVFVVTEQPTRRVWGVAGSRIRGPFVGGQSPR
ncbi:hypothetical protein [Sphingomonas sp.]|uniref:hypothetical protein n=1 Tax=Sphingomonas sp. TaxID=28214 RepID=UPI003CC53734